jgi:hypothetical protein
MNAATIVDAKTYFVSNKISPLAYLRTKVGSRRSLSKKRDRKIEIDDPIGNALMSISFLTRMSSRWRRTLVTNNSCLVHVDAHAARGPFGDATY